MRGFRKETREHGGEGESQYTESERERQSLGRFGPFGFGRVLEMERRVRDSAIVEIGPLNQMDLGCLGPFGRKETQWSNKIIYIFKIKFANPSVYTLQ